MDKDERVDAALEKIRSVMNENHSHMPWHQVVELLDEQGEKWQENVWSALPTDAAFDSLYAGSQVFNAFIYDEILYTNTKYGWDVHGETDEGQTVGEGEEHILSWMIDHPPFFELQDIGSLYLYAKHISAGTSPWLLYLYITGTAVTTQGAGLSSLMSIGSEDAKYLGRALTAWGEYNDVATTYTDMLVAYGAEE